MESALFTFQLGPLSLTQFKNYFFLYLYDLILPEYIEAVNISV